MLISSESPQYLKHLQRDIQVIFENLQFKKLLLKFERAHRDTILESINDGITVVDEEDRIQYVNRRFDHMFSSGVRDWYGSHVSELFAHVLNHTAANDLSNLQSIYYSVLGRKSQMADVCEIVWKQQQEPKYIRVYTGPVTHPEKDYLGRVWKFEDISREKELEQIKVEFVSLASHQLRTPLTTIWGYLKMIDEGDFGELPPDLAKPFGLLMHSTEKMRLLVNDLLDVSQLESGEHQLNLSEFDLIKVIAEEIDSQRLDLSQKHQFLEFSHMLDRIVVKSDQRLVQEMFKNYLSNAIKYTQSGKKIMVNVEFVNAKFLRVAVRDQGLGVPEVQQHRLFEKFYRADNVRTDEYEGTGLGLYFVKKSAQMLGGKVGFTSKVGEGSEFWFDLPLQN